MAVPLPKLINLEVSALALVVMFFCLFFLTCMIGIFYLGASCLGSTVL